MFQTKLIMNFTKKKYLLDNKNNLFPWNMPPSKQFSQRSAKIPGASSEERGQIPDERVLSGKKLHPINI